MKLLLDIGNTRFKWAWLDENDRFVPGAARDHREHALVDMLAEVETQAGRPSSVMISSVSAPAVTEALDAAIDERWQLRPARLRPAHEAFGVRCAYAEPQRLGADRWAALIGARARWPGAVAVLDFGTAVTLDALDAEGCHLGGLIAPGYRLMFQSLLRDTGGIAGAMSAPEAVPATDGLALNTADAVHEGVLACLAGFVTRVLVSLEQRWPAGYTLVITGGDAQRLKPVLPATAVFEPDLVLQGLARAVTEQP